MNHTDTTQPGPDDAAAALRGAEAARNAAERPHPAPVWYPPALGLLCAAGVSGLGIAPSHDAKGLILAGSALCALAFVSVIWIVQRRSGVAPWFPQQADGPAWRRWLTPLLPFVAATIVLFPYGAQGWLVAFGITNGLLIWVSSAQRRSRNLAAAA
ncbi:hypothetical protein E0L36_22605 [Streptomyces sp. AJS327]|uniref:hypothetical protein n=1 Tax=Streptomyces sp. AJS327 TaxID=2545265 RepID=UPI0015DEF510|nr:hypothetical protein [Streptomyces sp. AJS327]MBA0053565.1 hypothetical protein [Streptomyces sp. AJS327]